MVAASFYYSWWCIAVEVLAAARLTRVLVRDTLPPVRELRETLLRRASKSPWALVYVCAWCMGFHVAVALVLTHLLVATVSGQDGINVMTLVLLPFAISEIIGLLADREVA